MSWEGLNQNAKLLKPRESITSYLRTFYYGKKLLLCVERCEMLCSYFYFCWINFTNVLKHHWGPVIGFKDNTTQRDLERWRTNIDIYVFFFIPISLMRSYIRIFLIHCKNPLKAGQIPNIFPVLRYFVILKWDYRSSNLWIRCYFILFLQLYAVLPTIST